MLATGWSVADIKCLRLCRHRMTQRDFSNRANVGYFTVKAWETGRAVPDIESIRRLDAVATGWSSAQCRGLCGRKPADSSCGGHTLCNGTVIYCNG